MAWYGDNTCRCRWLPRITQVIPRSTYAYITQTYHGMFMQCMGMLLSRSDPRITREAHDWHLSCCHCTGTMMTSSNETFSALLAICAGNSPVTGEFPAQRPVTRSFGVFFDLRLNKRLSKQCWGWWFETPSRSLWRHCNDMLTCLFRSNHLYQNWPRVKERARWLVHSPQKGKYCVPVMFSLMLCWTCWMSQTVELSVIWEIMTLT